MDVPQVDEQVYYAAVGEQNLAPLWQRQHSSANSSPISSALPAHWSYDDVVRPLLLRAGGLITAKQAVRRVLVLENPALRGQARITASLFAGLQLILPGEVAPAHRHSQSALRFIIEGRGAYTAVEGERALMEPGDFIITPSWTWHDHGNETGGNMVWLDGLDRPIVSLFEAGFTEMGDADSQETTRSIGDNLARYGANMVPVDWQPTRQHSPVFAYPYLRSREALATLARNGEADRCHGYKLRYINPASGGAPMPTTGAFMQLFPAGFATEPYRATDGTVYSVVEGEGETVIGDTTFCWKPRDVFVVPSWCRHRHRASSEAILFSFSDRPVQQMLSLWREERGPALNAA
jgi:gentisate 1,2-dioxygenase